MFLSWSLFLILVGVAVYLVIRRGWEEALFLLAGVGSFCVAGFCAGTGIAFLCDHRDGNDLAAVLLLTAGSTLGLSCIAFWKQVLARRGQVR